MPEIYPSILRRSPMRGCSAAVAGGVLLLIAALPAPVRAQEVASTPGQAPEEITTPLLRAARSSELPLPAWGPYARGNAAPCCLVNRLLVQQFTFPIVVSQQREETLIQSVRSPDGKRHLHRANVTLLRRGMGLSATQATGEDRPNGPTAALNRRALFTEADQDGLLWRTRTLFNPAGLTQQVASLPDETGKPLPPPPWGAGEVTVDYFPAFADPNGDGLLIRVALTNRTDSAQTYCVDLLGGMDTQAEDFLPGDLKLLTAGDGVQSEGIVLHHPKRNALFALAAASTGTPLRAYRVDRDYFAPTGGVARRNADHDLLPGGMVEALPQDAPQAPGRQVAAVNTQPAPTTQAGARWGLIRLADIPVPPGQTVTLFLSVGVGQDAETARDSAQTLLGIADDARPNGQLREGAYTLAERVHRDLCFAPEDPGMARLMAQALGNTPLLGGRRLAVPSRQAVQGRLPGLYQATLGGMIALGYARFEPIYAAAELNIWFQTNTDPDVVQPNTTPLPPTNLFALWELIQNTRDHDMLVRFYPHARRRYLELLAAGQSKAGARLYAWPPTLPADLFLPALDASAAGKGGASDVPTPDFSAYLIRSALLLRALATRANRPAAEIARYAQDIQDFTKALNDRLWDAGRGIYAPGNGRNTDTVAGLLPLIAGGEALPAERSSALLKALTDPAAFWSPYGIRQISRASPNYRPSDPNHGAVRFGINWLLWKALLDMGETDTAARLAGNLLQAYRAAQSRSGGCPEWLDGDTGAPGGALDYSGDACALIPLYSAYHLAGTVSTGWNILLLDLRHDAMRNSLHLVYRNLEPTRSGGILCALGEPGARYSLTGSFTDTVSADAGGVVTLHAPLDGTTQEIDLTPITVKTP